MRKGSARSTNSMTAPRARAPGIGFVRHTVHAPLAQRAVRELHDPVAQPGAVEDRLRVAQRLGQHVGHDAGMAAGGCLAHGAR